MESDLLKRSKLKTYKPLKSGSRLNSTKPMKKSGKKAEEWGEAKEEIINNLISIGVEQTCEAQLERCTKNLYLTLAHSKRRRHIKSSEELKEVALLCQNCHAIVDSWKHAHTEYYIKQLIEKRTNEN